MTKVWTWFRSLNGGEWIATAVLVAATMFAIWHGIGALWNFTTFSIQPEVVAEGTRDYDLVAQRSMAAAAWWVVAITGVSALVGGFGLYLIARTLQEAKRSADAADRAVEASQKAIETAREMGQAQVRAYIMVSAVEMFPSGNGDFVTKIEFKNSGQTPATKVWVTANIFSGMGLDDAILADEESDAHSDLAGGDTGIIQFTSTGLQRQLRKRGKLVSSTIHLDVEIMYDDVFGQGQSIVASHYGFAIYGSGEIELTRNLE